MTDQTLFPYADTDGHSGTDTSRAAAETHRKSAGEHQRDVLELLGERKARGVTVVDVRNLSIPHHGTASRVLSVLHIGGKVLRLKESRDGAKVYVLPEYQMTRPIERYQGTTAKHKTQALTDARSTLERLRDAQSASPVPEYQMGWQDGVTAALARVQDLLDEVSAS